MASTSSRQAALERRKALTDGGKKSAGRYSSSPGRVRTADDARPARTAVDPTASSAPAAASAARPTATASRTASRPTRPGRSAPASLVSPQAAGRPAGRPAGKPVANPSRELVLARREALSRRGKRADSSKDRTRTDLPRAATAAAPVQAKAEHTCKCQDREAVASQSASRRRDTLSLSSSSRTASTPAGAAEQRRASTAKRAAVHNPSRALVLARREALSKRGKSSNTPYSTSAASVARQGNPDLSSRHPPHRPQPQRLQAGPAAGGEPQGGRQPDPGRPGGDRHPGQPLAKNHR
jgi:hypothetical protein